MMRSLRHLSLSVCMLGLVAAAPSLLAGCDQKEEVLKIETPESTLEVEENPDTGATDIEIETTE